MRDFRITIARDRDRSVNFDCFKTSHEKSLYPRKGIRGVDTTIKAVIYAATGSTSQATSMASSYARTNPMVLFQQLASGSAGSAAMAMVGAAAGIATAGSAMHHGHGHPYPSAQPMPVGYGASPAMAGVPMQPNAYLGTPPPPMGGGYGAPPPHMGGVYGETFEQRLNRAAMEHYQVHTFEQVGVHDHQYGWMQRVGLLGVLEELSVHEQSRAEQKYSGFLKQNHCYLRDHDGSIDFRAVAAKGTPPPAMGVGHGI